MYSRGTGAFHKLCHEPLPRTVRGKNNGNQYMEIGNVSVELSGKNRAYFSYSAQIGIQLVKEEIGVVSNYCYSNTTTQHQYGLRRALPTLHTLFTKYRLYRDKVLIEPWEIKKPNFNLCKSWISKRTKLKYYLDSLPDLRDLKTILFLNYSVDYQELENFNYWELYGLWYSKLEAGDSSSSISHKDIPTLSDLKNIHKEFHSYDDRYKEYIEKRDSTKKANEEKKESERAEKYRLFGEEVKKFLEESKDMTVTEKCFHLHSYPELIKGNYNHRYHYFTQEHQAYIKELNVFKDSNDLLVKTSKIVTTTRNVKFPVVALKKLCSNVDYNGVITELTLGVNLEIPDWDHRAIFPITLNNYNYDVSFDEVTGKIRVGCHRFDPEYLRQIVTLIINDGSGETTESSD